MRAPSPTAGAIQPSGIRAVFELAARTPHVIHLEVGEPDFPTPPHVVEAAHRAALDGHTGYVSNLGLPPLREALADKLRTRNHLDAATTEQVVVTHGATQGLLAALRSLVDPGDGVLVPDPGWPNYVSMVQAIHGEVQPYPLRPGSGFVPRPDDVERCITARTRVLLLNSPSNPIGSMTDAATARALLDVARRHDLWVVSDECYEDVTFEQPATAVASLDDDERVVSVFSFSKTYAMTGWRVGYVHVPERLRPVLSLLQEPLVSCVNAPAQHAALAALTGPQAVVDEMRRSYRERRDAVLEVFEGSAVRAVRPSGAFYLWADLTAAGQPAADLAEALVVERRVAVVPGGAFGREGDGHIRLSLATAREDLLEGCRRIAELLSERAGARAAG